MSNNSIRTQGSLDHPSLHTALVGSASKSLVEYSSAISGRGYLREVVGRPKALSTENGWERNLNGIEPKPF